jgi:hypothetical protein
LQERGSGGAPPVHRRARHQLGARKDLAASFFECFWLLGRLRAIQKVGMQRRFKAAEPRTFFAGRLSGDN